MKKTKAGNCQKFAKLETIFSSNWKIIGLIWLKFEKSRARYSEKLKNYALNFPKIVKITTWFKYWSGCLLVKLNNPINYSGECLDNWTGTLICPDFSGNFYAVGIYNSGPADQCQDNDNSGSNVPQEFISVVGVTAREAILELVASNAGDDVLTDETCDIDEGRFRCPLGSCLDKSQVILI